jgi:hypothetical protein
VVARTNEIQHAYAADFSPDERAVVFGGRDLSLFSWENGRTKQLGSYGRNPLLFVLYDASGHIFAGGYPEYLVITDGKNTIHRPWPFKGEVVSRLLPNRSGTLLVVSCGVLDWGSGFESIKRIKHYGSSYTDGYFEYACNADGSLLAHADVAGICLQYLKDSRGIKAGREFFVWPAHWRHVSLRFDTDDRLFVAHAIEDRVELLGFAPVPMAATVPRVCG